MNSKKIDETLAKNGMITLDKVERLEDYSRVDIFATYAKEAINIFDNCKTHTNYKQCKGCLLEKNIVFDISLEEKPFIEDKIKCPSRQQSKEDFIKEYTKSKINNLKLLK